MKRSTTLNNVTANKPKPVSANIFKPELDYRALYVGLDVHKENIAVAIVKPGRSEPEYRGEIDNKPKTVDKLLKTLTAETGDGILLVCYEADRCEEPLTELYRHQPTGYSQWVFLAGDP